MANLASGAGSAAKENPQKSASGGAVSANIDANRQANAAAYEAAQAEQAGGSDIRRRALPQHFPQIRNLFPKHH